MSLPGRSGSHRSEVGRKPPAHAELNQLLESPEYRIPRGIVLSRLNVEKRGKVLHLPWYAVFCLEEAMDAAGPLPIAALPAI